LNAIAMRSIVTAVLLTLAVNGAQAAEAVREPMELSESGRAYLEAISGRGIVSDVAYYDPFAPAPELKISAAPTEKPKVERGSGFSIQLVMVLIFAALLAGVVYAATQFGGARIVSFARAPASGRRRRAPSDTETAGWPDTADNLDVGEIGKISDRRAALMLLAQCALSTAAKANGLRIARSWTVRDTLRRLPADWPHLAALHRIASAHEITHYGGRAVSEEAFQSLLGLARSIFAERLR